MKSCGEGSRKARQNGFTLIELLVVVALIALMSVIAIPSVNSYYKVSLSSASRELAAAIKESYNAAVMTGQVHRVVYDVKNGVFWSEYGPRDLLLDTVETKEARERKKKFSTGTQEEDESQGFQLAKSITRKKTPLPRGVVFEDIETEQVAEKITDGITYTHIFPHGIAESTVIHLQDSSNHHVTLIVNPVLAQTRVIERYVSKEDSARE